MRTDGRSRSSPFAGMGRGGSSGVGTVGERNPEAKGATDASSERSEADIKAGVIAGRILSGRSVTIAEQAVKDPEASRANLLKMRFSAEAFRAATANPILPARPRGDTIAGGSRRNAFPRWPRSPVRDRRPRNCPSHRDRSPWGRSRGAARDVLRGSFALGKCYRDHSPQPRCLGRDRRTSAVRALAPAHRPRGDRRPRSAPRSQPRASTTDGISKCFRSPIRAIPKTF